MTIQFYCGFENALAQTQPQGITNSNHQSKNLCVGSNDYEGGEEDWLCSTQLAQYITDSDCEGQLVTEAPLRVLELGGYRIHQHRSLLGCGSARPALALAQKRARLNLSTQLYLQELNTSAAQYTIASAQQLLTDSMGPGLVSIIVFTSDWIEMAKVRKEKAQFHVILMAETLYRPTVFSDILEVIMRVLRQDGVCLSAQKKFYFGCGGGQLPFSDFLRQEGGDRVVETVLAESADPKFPPWAISRITLT